MTTSLASLPALDPATGVVFRRYRGLDDIPGMGSANARLRAHAGVLEQIDLDAMAHRYTHLVNSDPLVDCLVVERHGVTVGYARVEWHDLVDGDRVYDTTLLVAPDAWGLGIAGALLGWAEERSRELAATNPTGRRSWLANAAFDGDAELGGTLRERSYAAVRWDAEMKRPDLEAIEDVPVAEGYHLRSPDEDELPAVFAMSVAAFAEHWGQYEADDQRLDGWVDDPRFRRDLIVVAWQGDEPAAFVNNVIETQPDGSLAGLLAGVATHPDHRRRGLARACIAESLRRLRDTGASSAYLGVDTDNDNRASTLYESCGFRVASSTTSYRKPLEPVEAP